jgi:NTE family protein
MNIGLVLTGGGARAAYQVGVIQAISEIDSSKEIPFKIITGTSTGAINGGFLMSRADDFQSATAELWELWSNIHTHQVYRTDPKAMAALGTRWLGTLGGFFKPPHRVNHLLNTDPLRTMLTKELRLERLPHFFQEGLLHGVGITATNYHTGTGVSFFDGSSEIKPWVRSTRIGTRGPITIDHILASSSIPLFFPPIKMNGIYYADGCIRLNSPLSPAIHLGADRIIAIGIRHQRTHKETVEVNLAPSKGKPSLAEIGGAVLNSVFLDSLDTDIERMERINGTLSILSDKDRAKIPVKLRHIPILALRPSQDLGELAVGTLHEFPSIIRFLLRGLGAKENKGWDLISYLAFEKAYTNQLIALGYKDTIEKKDTVINFMRGSLAPRPGEALNSIMT